MALLLLFVMMDDVPVTASFQFTSNTACPETIWVLV